MANWLDGLIWWTVRHSGRILVKVGALQRTVYGKLIILTNKHINMESFFSHNRHTTTCLLSRSLEFKSLHVVLLLLSITHHLYLWVQNNTNWRTNCFLAFSFLVAYEVSRRVVTGWGQNSSLIVFSQWFIDRFSNLLLNTNTLFVEWYSNVLHQISHNAQSTHACWCNKASDRLESGGRSHSVSCLTRLRVVQGNDNIFYLSN